MAASDVYKRQNPLFAIWECMARRSYWDRHSEPEQAISFAEALRLHTIEGARALGMDHGQRCPMPSALHQASTRRSARYDSRVNEG